MTKAISFMGSLVVVLLALSQSSSAAGAEDAYRFLLPVGVAPHAVVLLVPGCSGFVATDGGNVYDRRGVELQAAGYMVVFVDYVGRRLQSNCAHVSQSEVSTDILEAATWARRQKDVDADRIYVIGWSYGGGGVLAALAAMPAESSITRAVMYYPVCRGARRWASKIPGLMLLGASDDVALPAFCNDVAKGVSADRLRVIMYPNARHGFDLRGSPEGRDQPGGAPVYSSEAADASWAAVRDFLK